MKFMTRAGGVLLCAPPPPVLVEVPLLMRPAARYAPLPPMSLPPTICAGTECVCAGISAVMSVWFCAPPAVPREAVPLIPPVDELEPRRFAAVLPILSSPNTALPRRSGTLNVVDPSPTPNVVLVTANSAE